MSKKKEKEIAIKEVKLDTLAAASNHYMDIINYQLSTHSMELDDYQRTCANNAISTMYSLITDSGRKFNDFDQSNIRQIVERTAILRLNAFSEPREIYFQIRNKKVGRDWIPTLEMGIEGDGNDSILRNFGVGVKEVYNPWIVREQDEFSYPEYVGVSVEPPTWKPSGKGKAVRVVYPILMENGKVEYHISERADVRKNLYAHISNNLMNETFGIAKNRYNATDAQRKKIDEKKAETFSLMDGKNVDEILDIPELDSWISPAWKGDHARESMIIRKMRNNATKPIPKDFQSGYGASAYHVVSDPDVAESVSKADEYANSGEIIDAEYMDVVEEEETTPEPQPEPQPQPEKKTKKETKPEPQPKPQPEPKEEKEEDGGNVPF